MFDLAVFVLQINAFLLPVDIQRFSLSGPIPQLVLRGPVAVGQDGNLIEEMEYGNHPGVRGHAGVIVKTVVGDEVTGRALFFLRELFFSLFDVLAFPR